MAHRPSSKYCPTTTKTLQELRATLDEYEGLTIFETDVDNRNITIYRNLSALLLLAREVRASLPTQVLPREVFKCKMYISVVGHIDMDPVLAQYTLL